MADSEEEAARAKEKLAAAKKRIEELRKKKKPKKAKPDSPIADGESAVPAVSAVSAAPAAPESPAKGPDVPTVEFPDLDTPLPASTPPAGASHSRTASLHARRISTSTGLRRPSVTGADILRSGSGSPLSPTDLPDIYRKQATTISELTEAVERLEGEAERLKGEAKRLSEAAVQRDEALEQLVAVKTELREAIDKASVAVNVCTEREEETEKLKSEVASLTRQSSHLASQLSQKDQTISDLRRHNSPNQDRESLTAKEDQIETMEMEISKLRGDLERATKNHADTLATLARTEQTLNELSTTHDSTTAELATTKAELATASAQQLTDAATIRAAETLTQSLQREVDALTTAARTQAATIANHDRATPKPERRGPESRLHGTGSTQQDSDDVDALEDAVRVRLQRRIQQLEAELLKKEPALEEVNLRPEDEAEMRRRGEAERIERVKDVKRGLETWRGWRLDLTVLGGGMGFGPVFEV